MAKSKKEDAKGAKHYRSRLDAELDRIESEIDIYKRDVVDPEASFESLRPAKSAKHAVPVKPVKPFKVPDADTVEETIEEKVTRFEMPSLNIDMRALARVGFYFITSLLCMGVLAYLFGRMETFVFFSALGVFLWWWSHQFHATESGTLRSFLSLGSVVVFLYLFYWLFNDLFSLLFCVLYALSFIIAGVLYFYHLKREMSEEVHRSFPLTFLVVFYSHVIAFTAASALAFVLPKVILSGSFVSILYLVFAWMLPVLLVYFFLTKYLYLSFFDRKHPWRDALKGFVHGAIYTFVFVMVIWLVYFLTAIQFVGMERDKYDGTFSDMFTMMQNAKSEIKGSPFLYDSPELLNMRVSQDVIALSESLVADATVLKSRIDRESFSFNDYISDGYFTILSRDRFEISRAKLFAEEIDEVKSDLFREYDHMKQETAVGVFIDGTGNLQDHRAALVDYVSGAASAYAEPFEFTRLKEKIYADDQSFDSLVSDGELVDFTLLYHPDLGIIEPGESRFSIMFYDMIYHTALFRDFALMVSETLMLGVEETLNPYSLIALRTPAEGETVESQVLRFRIIRSDVGATLSLAGSGAE